MAGDLLMIGLLAVLLGRGRVRRFPFFTIYIGSNLAGDAILYYVSRHGSHSAYFDAYWILRAIDVAAQLGVFYEIAGMVFRPLGVWAADIRKRFTLLALGSLAVAALLTWLASPPTEYFVQTVVIKGSFFVACLMSELFVITTALSTRVGLAWRNHVSAVAQGIGIYSITTVIIEGANSYLGAVGAAAAYARLERVRVVLYTLCLCYWNIRLYQNEPVRREITPEMRAKLFTLQRDLAYDLGQIRSRENK
jgi:hypothetical protein